MKRFYDCSKQLTVKYFGYVHLYQQECEHPEFVAVKERETRILNEHPEFVAVKESETRILNVQTYFSYYQHTYFGVYGRALLNTYLVIIRKVLALESYLVLVSVIRACVKSLCVRLGGILCLCCVNCSCRGAFVYKKKVEVRYVEKERHTP